MDFKSLLEQYAKEYKSPTERVAQLVIQLTFLMSTGTVKLKFDPENNPPIQYHDTWEEYCRPHECLRAYLKLFNYIHQYVSTSVYIKIQRKGNDKVVFKVSNQFPKDDFLRVILIGMRFDADYIQDLLKGVNFSVEIKDQCWIAYQFNESGKWHMLSRLSNTKPIASLCSPVTTVCYCNQKYPNFSWHHMSHPRL